VRLPPSDENLERAVLGACLVDEGAILRAMEHLDTASFTLPQHQAIWSAVVSLHRQGRPADLTLIKGELNNDPIWLLAIEIAGEIATSAHVGAYAERLAGLARRREALLVCEQSAAELCDLDADGDPVVDLLSKALAVQGEATTKAEPADAIAERVFERIHKAYQTRSPYAASRSAMVSGLYDLDRVLFVKPSDYVVLAARPSAGKTALAIQLIEANAEKRPVFFASLEMSRDAIVQRMLSQATGVSSYRQNQPDYLSADELEQLERATVNVGALNLWIDDRPSLTVAQIFSAAQVHQARRGLGMVVIDHMSLIRPANPKASMYEAMTQISKDLKAMTRRLGVPVLALAQLSREVEKSDRKPRNSDLRDSGSVEQDADIILMLHRPDRTAAVSNAELLVTKNRDGALADIALVFQPERQRFQNATREWAL
jgi:replicative DNA helicase